MALKDLLRRGPRNIRKRLFRDIIVIILITVGAILIITLIQGKSIKDDISAQLISETSLLVKKRFISYLTPYDTSLKILAQFGSSGVLQPSEPNALEQIIHPIFDVHPDVKRITLMQETGLYQEFSRTDRGYETSTLKTWPKDDIAANPAFQRALSAPQNKQVFWSESFTSYDKETGLSASIRIDLPQQSTALVLLYFIPAEKIISFISDIEIDQDIDIVMFNNQGLFLSRWNLEATQVADQDANASLQLPWKPKESDVVTLWQQSSARQRAAQKIRQQGITYWAGFAPLSDDTTSWIGVIVPESAIIKNVYKQWLELGLIAGVILLVAVALTINLVRKYSFQLKDLPQQNLFTTALKDNVVKLIHAGESSTLEFKSTMRNNLQSGKHGKEIEIAWLKTVTAFMNSDGGILLIGVRDDGTIVGNEADEFASEDKCGLHFKNLINSHIGTDYSRFIHMKVCDFDDNSVIVIECERVRRPVFLKVGKTEDFYIRTGPSSMKMSMSQMVAYLAER
jgi:hypothetical protein